MEENIIHIEENSYTCYRFQTVIVGSGAAGLNAAVSLAKEGQTDIAIITEGRMMGTSRNTGSDKQTYYKLTTCGDEADSIRKMAQTLFDGKSMDGDLALVEAALSIRGFYHLVDIGVPFPCNETGEYVGYKTDHDPNQRGTSAGPLTSKYMTEALWKEAERYHIPVYDGFQVIELLMQSTGAEKRIRGIVALNMKVQEADKAFTVFSADNVIYATGGEAGMYETSVYPISQIGGMGTAFRIGAKGKNLTESQYGIASIKFRWNLSGTFQQVIPRYVSTAEDGTDEKEFLDAYFDDPSELIQAIFLKGYQWPFDPRKTVGHGSSLIDLLVYQETVLKGRRVFLDYRKNPSCIEKNGNFDEKMLSEEALEYLKNSDGLWNTPIERLQHMNPEAIELYQTHGIDIREELLEIAVCAQHNNGGLSGNQWWESNVKHLFPVGEVNGTHGVYRPGGSALNSGQVGSLRAAQYITHRYTDEAMDVETLAQICGQQIMDAMNYGKRALDEKRKKTDLSQEKKKLGIRMSKAGANIRSEKEVRQALAENREQQNRLNDVGVKNVAELKHLYRIRDLLISQQVYLEAILDYILQGGGSRGSYLIYSEEGQKPLEALPECFRFRSDEDNKAGSIQEVEYTPEGCTCTWRKIRPIPEQDNWFEKVWRDFREDIYYRRESK